MKKKIMALALVVALAAIAVTGTLAWFTDTDKADNVFTVGQVAIDHNEYSNEEKTEEFKDRQMLLPVIDTVEVANDPNYEFKVVNVQNIGKNDAFVRTFVAIPAELKNYITLDFYRDTNWAIDEAVESNGFWVYRCVYNKMLAKNNSVTDDLLKGVYMNPEVDLRDDPTTTETSEKVLCLKKSDGSYVYSNITVNQLTEITVSLISQAVQAEGFGENPDILGILNTAFGTEIPNFN